MKKIGATLLVFLFAIALVYAVLQSSIGKDFIRQTIVQSLASSGFTVAIGEIEGILPNEIYLKNVSIQGDGVTLTAREIDLRPIFWRFFQGEVAFKDIHAKDLSLNASAPFNFDGKFWMNAHKGAILGQIDGWKVHAKLTRAPLSLQFDAESDLGSLKGSATPFSADIQFHSDTILQKLIPLASGKISLNLALVKEKETFTGNMDWQVSHLIVDQTEIGQLEGKGDGTFRDSLFKGKLTSGSSQIAFDWDIRPGLLIVGNNHIAIDNLQSLHIPNLYGKLQGELLWQVQDGAQGLKLDAAVDNFYYKEFFAQKALLYSDIQERLFDIRFEKAKWRELRFSTLALETKNESALWPFTLTANGEWKHPLQVEMKGLFQDSLFHIDTFTGTFFNHPFVLEKPVDYKWSDTQLDLSPVQLKIADAAILAEIHGSSAMVQLDRLPLDFLSLNPLDVPIEGSIDLKAEIHDQQGALSAHIQQISPFNASGAFTGNFNRDTLQLQGHLNVKESPFAEVDLSLPIHFSLFPFKAEILPMKEAKGTLAFDGSVEEFLDFFDIGPHRLEGKCRGKLSLHNTFYNPSIEGAFTFENGSYENYYTGTRLKNIRAEFFAEKNTLHLRSLSAIDEPGDGLFSATGQIKLDRGDLYPFHFAVTLDDFQFTGIDLVTVSADGDIRLNGNTTSALASGNLLITESVLSIPDHIRNPLPELDVVYIHQNRPTPPPSTSDYTPYPIYLDLHVNAPNVRIAGKGLSSEWQGNFHLGGTMTDPATQGELKLVEGAFHLSSKNFDLTHGSLLFSGLEHEMPSIDLSGEIETKGIAITVQIHGPLDHPQVDLHSNPPLPLSSIMSHLLFGQELSEISGFQALELASSLAGLAGAGPDVLENARRSLGIDRLRIITDSEHGEMIALEVGKYIAKGVLVTLTQGTQESSTNIRIEVEIKGNLILQLESDQRQEQGKFTIKWQINY